ncbi:unnamed protein product [Calypogeia fissa]
MKFMKPDQVKIRRAGGALVLVRVADQAKPRIRFYIRDSEDGSERPIREVFYSVPRRHLEGVNVRHATQEKKSPDESFGPTVLTVFSADTCSLGWD